VALVLVDLLEVVEVDQHDRQRAAGAAGALHLAAQRLVQRGVVHAAGKAVGAGGLGQVGVHARVAARDRSELGEALQQLGVVVGHQPVAGPAGPQHAAQLAVPAHRDRYGALDLRERGAHGGRAVAAVVVGEDRAAEVERLGRDAAARLRRRRALLGRLAGRLERERVAGRAAEHADALGVEDRRGLLADAGEHAG
jgi:hypothetical protein